MPEGSIGPRQPQANSQTSTPLAPPAPAGWTDDALAAPHKQQDKADRVRGMFSAIAKSYDLNNRVHSLGRDQAWRRFAVKAAGVKPGERVLDVACGTGDLTEAFARRSPASEVVGLDFTPGMLEIAREKTAKRQHVTGSGAGNSTGGARVSYVEGDAMNLQIPDASFDVVSIAFGIRNVSDPAKALREFARVLKPGGRLVVLEFDRPKVWPVNWLNDVYCGWVMPRTATLISGDRSGAYRYLPRSVSTFMSREAMRAAMEAAGFRDITAKGLTLGICVCYRGVRG
jgi:demethylmenaquinone methyltransferase / 2-methoxy-6-polyprenyl-1,4-benzoquinol methylase